MKKISLTSSTGTFCDTEIIIDNKKLDNIQFIDLHMSTNEEFGVGYLYDSDGNQYKIIIKKLKVDGVVKEENKCQALN